MGLLDFAQGASNAAASTVSAPVDGIAWLLRRAGVPIPEAPIGGSEWMARQGLTREPKDRVSGLLGETAAMAAPMVAAAKAPQIARGLLQAAQNAAAPRTLNPQTGAIVWHGSPHKFDKFDSSKIGTGEGAQAYGHGLYLAESPEVAKHYSSLTGATQEARDMARVSQMAANTPGGSWDFWLDSAQSSPFYKPSAGEMEAARKLRDLGIKPGQAIPGALYKVDLPDDAIAKMLDWDKPLSQQAGAMRALGISAGDPLTVAKSQRGFSVVNARTGDVVSDGWGSEATAQKFAGLGGANPAANLTGKQYYEQLGSGQNAADAMRRAGIPGIRYLDGGSRGAGGGTSNFVIFPGEESLLTILERNGAPVR